MDERMSAAYLYILEGGTRRQISARVAARFGVSHRTADDDYTRAMKTLKNEQIQSKEDLLNQIQALRLVTVHKALKRGQYQTVCNLLKDLGATVGEVLPEQLAAQAPQLNLVIEPPGKNNSKGATLAAGAEKSLGAAGQIVEVTAKEAPEK